MSAAAVERFRAFNRFFTGTIGVLGDELLQTEFSLGEARVLFELGRAGELETVSLRTATGLDAGYASRILSALAKAGLVTCQRSPADSRRQLVTLTAAGRRAYRRLDRRSAAENARLLSRLSTAEAGELLAAAATIEQLLGGASSEGALALRSPAAGDLGWVVERHGTLYAREYGWDATFEGLVAQIVGDFGRAHDPARERGFIAELGGRRAGCVFCVDGAGGTAKLRILLVEPWARGHGVGGRLVDACIAFARASGYERLELWTNDVLVAARRIYERAGFRLVDEAPHRAFGHDLVEQTWSLDLS